MGVTSAIVLYVVLWFLTFLCVIPVHIRTQGETGHIVPGTHAGSPEQHHLKRKAWITTGIATVLWILIAGIIITGTITVRDIDFWGRMGPAG